jgi:hypothetical protein
MSKKNGKAKKDYPSKLPYVLIYIEISMDRKIADFDFDFVTLEVPESSL